MRIGILTSSRSDFGIYLPLLLALKDDSFFDLELIVFGTHLSKEHGYTISEIKKYDFQIIHEIHTPVINHSSTDISKNIAETVSLFSNFWTNNDYDYIFSFGDRYEMFAAVTAASPFNRKIIHYSAGETTLGAIDNMYRHAISLMSNILFVSADDYYKKALQINPDAKVYNVGSLSIDNLKTIDYLSIEEFYSRFNIDMSIPSILSTFHPETTKLDKNIGFIYELLDTFDDLSKKYQIILTLPNADTQGDKIREIIYKSCSEMSNIKVVESFGMVGYLSCMKYCKMMIGNTSSGFVEASYFPTNVINIGNRQDGRIVTDNILNAPIKKNEILNAVDKIEKLPSKSQIKLYGDGDSAKRIIEILKVSNIR